MTGPAIGSMEFACSGSSDDAVGNDWRCRMVFSFAFFVLDLGNEGWTDVS